MSGAHRFPKNHFSATILSDEDGLSKIGPGSGGARSRPFVSISVSVENNVPR